MSFFDKYYLSK
jgi:hypothetical protein